MSYIPSKYRLADKRGKAKDGRRLIHAHHENYNYPLDVVWLCPKHHFARHREIYAAHLSELRPVAS